jgi:hypothetical protein
MNDDKAIRLMLAYLCIAPEAEASLDRKIQILDRFGLSVEEIATVCDRTPQSVRNARSLMKKRDKHDSAK